MWQGRGQPEMLRPCLFKKQPLSHARDLASASISFLTPIALLFQTTAPIRPPVFPRSSSSAVVPMGVFESKLAAMLGMDTTAAVQPVAKLVQPGAKLPEAGPPPPYAEAAVPTTTSIGVQTAVNGLAAQAERAQQRASAAELHGQVARLQAELRASRASQRAAPSSPSATMVLAPSAAAGAPQAASSTDAAVGRQLRLAIQTLARMLLETEVDRALTDGQRRQVLRLLELTAR